MSYSVHPIRAVIELFVFFFTIQIVSSVLLLIHHLLYVLFGPTIWSSNRAAKVWTKNSGLWEHRIGFWKRQSKVHFLFLSLYGICVARLKTMLNYCFFASVLHGSQVVASDLRGGVSLVLAGLAAEGNTEIDGVAHIDRGYENLEMKLQLLGADVKRLIPAATAP